MSYSKITNMDRQQKQLYKRGDKLMQALEQEVDQEWENLAQMLCGPGPVGSFPWALA
uniref:Uncharacterized protein n=2 Tax=Anopheles atroparvus TaxID=41427 RepID=A0AAG5DG26_ANOAO